MLFGSERFEPYIGRLALASAASMEGSLSMHRLQVRQQKREVDIALKLVEFTTLYVEGDVDAFKETLRAEAKELAAVSFGRACCTLSPSCTPAERRSSSVTRPRCWG